MRPHNISMQRERSEESSLESAYLVTENNFENRKTTRICVEIVGIHFFDVTYKTRTKVMFKSTQYIYVYQKIHLTTSIMASAACLDQCLHCDF